MQIDLPQKHETAREFVTFRTGGQDFGVDIMSVREIRGWTACTPLPQTPDYVRGVINLRGTVLPILDFNRRLGRDLSEPTARHVIIVAHLGERIIGLLVEAVSDILTAEDGDIQVTPESLTEANEAFVSGILLLGDRLIGLISLRHVLPNDLDLAA